MSIRTLFSALLFALVSPFAISGPVAIEDPGMAPSISADQGLLFMHVSDPKFVDAWVSLCPRTGLCSYTKRYIRGHLDRGYGVFPMPPGEYRLQDISATVVNKAGQLMTRTWMLSAPVTIHAGKVSSLGTLITGLIGERIISYELIRNHADALRVIRARNVPISASLTEVDIVDASDKYIEAASIPLIRQQLLDKKRLGGLAEGRAFMEPFSVQLDALARNESNAVIASELGSLGFASADGQSVQMIPTDTLATLRVLPQYGNADSPPQSWFVASTLGDVYRVRNMKAERLTMPDIYPAYAAARLGELLVIADEQGSVAISRDEGEHWETHLMPAPGYWKGGARSRMRGVSGGALLVEPQPGWRVSSKIHQLRGALISPEGTVSRMPWIQPFAAAVAPQYINGTIVFEKEFWFKSSMYVLDTVTEQWIKRPMPAMGCSLRVANDVLLANQCDGKKHYQSTDLGQSWLPVPELVPAEPLNNP